MWFDQWRTGQGSQEDLSPWACKNNHGPVQNIITDEIGKSVLKNRFQCLLSKSLLQIIRAGLNTKRVARFYCNYFIYIVSIKGPARDLFFAQKHALQEKLSRLVDWSDFRNFFFVRQRKTSYRAHWTWIFKIIFPSLMLQV